MASDWRFVCRHVRYWRGTIQKWSTVYRYQGTPFSPLTSADVAIVERADAEMCYWKSATDGGTYQVEVYNVAAGGAPILTTNYFDPETPGAWTGFGATSWITTAPKVEPQAEVALLAEWAAGTSSSGKPVYFRKYYHSVPQSAASAGAVDVLAADVTALSTAASYIVTCLGARGLALGTPGRTTLTSAVVRPYYYNHQMPRGRRRPALVSASGQYKGPTIQGRPLPVIAD